MSIYYLASPSVSNLTLSTAWMPLNGLIEQWATFGSEATASPALQATSMAFCALARETEAYEHHTAAWHTSPTVDVTTLEQTLDTLLQARAHWTEVIRFLGILVLDEQPTIPPLIVEAMRQRTRISTLIHEVEQEQLATCCSAPLSSQRGGSH